MKFLVLPGFHILNKKKAPKKGPLLNLLSKLIRMQMKG